MSIIAPIKEDIQYPQHTKRYSAPLRLWHWINMIVIAGSLLTVLLNSTISKGKNAAQVIKSALQKTGVMVTDAQVKNVTHNLSDKVWDVHVYFSYDKAEALGIK